MSPELYDLNSTIQPISPQEEFELFEEKPDHHFRTEIPNIVSELVQKGIICPITFLVYFFLKKICGDSGKCWSSISTLAKQCNISETKLKECLKTLCSPLIGDLPLIQKIKRIKSDGSPDTSLIKIVPIWRENGDFYRKGGVGRQTTGGGSPKNPGGSPRDYKEDLSQEDLSKKQQQQAAVVFQIYPSLKDVQIPHADKEWLTKNHSEKEVDHAIKWSKSPGVIISKSLAAALKWAAKSLPVFGTSTEEKVSKNRKDALDVENNIKSSCASFVALSSHCEVAPNSSPNVLIFSYDSDSFHSDVYHALAKYKFTSVAL